MPGGRISLEEGLADSPQVRVEATKREKYLPPLKEYATLLRDTFQACSIHQDKVCEGTDALSKLLNAFQGETMGEQETFIPKAFFRLSRYLSELNSCQEMLSSQLQNAVIELLSQFISADFGNLEKLRESHETASQEHEQAATKYSRQSKKKDSEKARFEANAELFSARKKLHESSLAYYTELNCFQHKKQFAILEPLLTFMHAQMAYFKVGHEILSGQLANLLTDLNTQVQKVHVDYQNEVLMSAQTRADIELRFHSLCLPDPDPTDPFTDQPALPNTSLTSKAGYLFVRMASGFPPKWDRTYFFTKKGYLYIHTLPKPPELIINLKGAEATPTDIDDRRYAFSINHSSLKRPIYLIAEGELQRDEWIATINNIGYDRGHAMPRSNTKKDEAMIKLEREKIRSWVNKEIDPKKDKSAGIPKIPKVSPVPATPTNTTQPSTFPSLPSFLNFLDPSSQSNQSDTPSQKKSPVFPRKPTGGDAVTSFAKKSPSSLRKGSVNTPTAGGQGSTNTPPAGGQGVSSPPAPHPKDLPSPLQPERLTAGGVAAANSRPLPAFSKTFYVKYLGHMEVPEGRNISLITDTIQKVMVARTNRSVKDAQAIEMTVTNRSICLYDHTIKKPIGQIVLRDILRCAVQPDSAKLFGIVNRTGAADADKGKFICHVMESNKTGSDVCAAINEAIQTAVRIMQQGRSKSTAKQGKGTPTSSSATPPISNAAKSLPKQISKSASEPTFTGDGFPRPTSQSLQSLASDDGIFILPSLPETQSSERPPRAGGVASSSHTSQGSGGGVAVNLSSQQLVYKPSGAATSTNDVSSQQGGCKPPGGMAAAASSSDYYQMPSSLQGLGTTTETQDTFSDGEMDSPLPPLDDVLGSFGGDVSGSGTTASGPPSGYFQLPTSALDSTYSADTSSSPPPLPLLGGSLADTGSSYLPSVTSSAVSNGVGGASLFGDNAGEDILSSSDAAISNVSSQQGVNAFNPFSLEGTAASSTADSGYLPPPLGPNSVPETTTTSAESALIPVTVSSSIGGIPGGFPGMGLGGDDGYDDFDLPPLPDSMDLPPPPSSYGGSFVTIGTPRNNQ